MEIWKACEGVSLVEVVGLITIVIGSMVGLGWVVGKIFGESQN